MSLIDEGHGRRCGWRISRGREPHVNGVAKLHSELMKRTIFTDFAELYPDALRTSRTASRAAG